MSFLVKEMAIGQHGPQICVKCLRFSPKSKSLDSIFNRQGAVLWLIAGCTKFGLKRTNTRLECD